MAINDISLTAGMRSNLTSLQNTVTLLNRTQGRLSSGKKVNSALDDPLSFFTAQALNSRAADLSSYKDGMSEAVQTVQAANNGITALTSLIAQAKSLAASAKSSPTGGNFTEYDLSLTNVQNGDQFTIGGTTYTAVDAAHAPVNNDSYDITLADKLTNGDTITIGGVTFTASSADSGTQASGATSYDFTAGTSAKADATALNAAIQQAIDDGNITGISTANPSDGKVTVSQTAVGTPQGDWVTGLSGANLSSVATTSVDWTQLTATQFEIGATDAATAQNLADKANGTAGTQGAVAANADGVAVANLANALTITIGTATQTNFNDTTHNEVTTGTSGTMTNVLPNDRLTYANQFIALMQQFDNVASDSGYKGVNFLGSSTLALDFGNGHTLNMTGFDGSGAALFGNTAIADAATNHWRSDANIDAAVAGLNNAATTLKAKSSELSANLSIINVRQDWTTSMINTLTQGADNLTLADMNEEGANMLMLQTRQSLGTTALSLSSQAAQSVLRLFQ